MPGASRPLLGLDALNFFLADVRDGLGPYLAIAATQSIAGIAGAIFPPALAAITLGIVGPKMFAKRIGRNEGFNHAGNAVSAVIAGCTAYFFGPIVVFWLMAALAVLSLGATRPIPAGSIDNEVACGLDKGDEGESELATSKKFGVLKALLQNKSLMMFALLAAIFHLLNAAMLTSVGQLLTKLSGKDNATSLISICIVAARFVMVPVAVFVGARADAIGRKPIFLVAFGVLAVRGVLYTLSDNPFLLVGVQLLVGIGAASTARCFLSSSPISRAAPGFSTSARARWQRHRV